MLLKIFLFGQFKITADDQPVELPSRPAQSLLAFLALNAGVVYRREKLASLFWPDTTEKNARGYLRQALWRIRKTFDSIPLNWQDYLNITDIDVQFLEESEYWLDAKAFLEQTPDECPERIIEKLNLYREELLPGFYDDWIQLESDRFQAAFHQKMNVLLETLLQARDWANAIKWSENWIRLGKSPEPAYRFLMQAYAGMGDQAMASATYQRCIEALDRELGLDPSPETQLLYTKICCGELEMSTAPSAAPYLPEASPQIPDFLKDETQIHFETPLFVAREKELNQLETFLNLADSGQGRVAFITGEAGSGKTALINEFTRRAQSLHHDVVIASGNCNAHTGLGDPYLPFREILEMLTGHVKSRWVAGAITQTQAERLWRILPVTARSLVEISPNLIDTFIPGAPLIERVAGSAGSNETWLKRLNELVSARVGDTGYPTPIQSDLLEQYTRVLRSVAEHAPLVLILDDLQWADLGSINLLFHLGTQLSGSRILVVGSYRPEEVAIGKAGERHPLSSIVRELQRIFGKVEINLDQAENRDFVEALLDSEPNGLGQPFREMLFRQTRGNPLFLTELLRGLQERGDLVQDETGQWVEGPALDWDTIPARVEAVITERIDRLPMSLQRTLRIASVEGEVFTVEVLARLLSMNEQELVNQLSEELDRKHRLVRAQSIQRINGQLLSSYRFGNIQTQRFLYGSLNPIERVHLHQQVGEVLESLHGLKDSTDELANLFPIPAVQLARHFQQAEVIPKAIHYLNLAGVRAVMLSGYQEAIAHLQKGQSLLSRLPGTPERARLALSLQLSLGKAMKGATSMGMPEVEKIYMLAHKLCQEVGEPEQLWTVLGELAIVYYVRGGHMRALDYAQKAFDLSHQIDDPVITALSHWILGVVNFALGEFQTSRDHMEKTISFYDPEKHFERFVYLRGVDAGLSASAYQACNLWSLGYPDQAVRNSREVIAKAEQLNHPFTLADVLAYGGCVLNELTNNSIAEKEYADRLLILSETTGLSWRAASHRYRGESMAMLGQMEEGIEEGKHGMSENTVIYAECCVLGMLTNIGYVCAKAGDISTSKEFLDQAYEIANGRLERYYEAEMYRKVGEVELLKGDAQAAEENFLKAMEVSQRQKARSFELRAATSLARLWQQQGKREEAKKILSEVYDWFTEGFDTPDLLEAKTLLEKLT